MIYWFSMIVTGLTVFGLAYGTLQLIAVRVLGAADAGPHPFLVEFVEGDPVRDRLFNTLDGAKTIAWSLAVGAFAMRKVFDLPPGVRGVAAAVTLLGGLTGIVLWALQRKERRVGAHAAG